MKDGRNRLKTCLLIVAMIAVVLGFFYYYYNGQEQTIINEGTLICLPGVNTLWQ